MSRLLKWHRGRHQLVKRWPMFCRDLKQLAGDKRLVAQTSTEHHALSDAKWTRDAWLDLQEVPATG